MEDRKRGMRLLGLLAVAALGVMAFTGSARAVNPGFLIAKKPALAATFGAVIDPGTVVKLLAPSVNFHFTCTAFTVDEGLINTTTDAKLILLYSGCTVLETQKLAEIPCEVVEPIKAEALVLPAELTDGKPALLAEKVKELIRLTKLGDLTKPCILPEDNTVTGEFCFKITDATNDTTEPLIEAPATCKNRSALEGTEVTSGGVPDLLIYGGGIMVLDMKAVLSLTGEHKALTLGVSLF